MKTLNFSNYEDFACEIENKFVNLSNEYDDISIVAKYDEAKEIIKELVCIGYSIVSIDINSPNYDNYYDEYIISLNSDGISCESMRKDGEYIENYSSITYIMDNCSSRVIPHCISKQIYEVNIEENFDTDFDDELLVEYSEDNDRDMHGFTASKADENGCCTFSFYTSEALDKEDINEMLKRFGF